MYIYIEAVWNDVIKCHQLLSSWGSRDDYNGHFLRLSPLLTSDILQIIWKTPSPLESMPIFSISPFITVSYPCMRSWGPHVRKSLWSLHSNQMTRSEIPERSMELWFGVPVHYLSWILLRCTKQLPKKGWSSKIKKCSRGQIRISINILLY